MGAKQLQDGDIVQHLGRGVGMRVVITDEERERDQGRTPEWVACEWQLDGVTHRSPRLHDELELVGSRQRQSHEEIYAWITSGAVASVTALISEGRREQALGAMRMWSDTVGMAATDEDRLRLQQLVDRVSGSPQ